jgi:hypothetical protein
VQDFLENCIDFIKFWAIWGGVSCRLMMMMLGWAVNRVSFELTKLEAIVDP